MKSSLQKKKDNVSSTYYKKRADKAWGELIHLLFTECPVNDECSGRMEAHHVLSRSRIASRHNPKNGIGLCTKHHKYDSALSPHAGPVGFSDYMEREKPLQWAFARGMMRFLQQGKPNYKLRAEALRAMIEIAQKRGARVFCAMLWSGRAEVGRLLEHVEENS